MTLGEKINAANADKEITDLMIHVLGAIAMLHIS